MNLVQFASAALALSLLTQAAPAQNAPAQPRIPTLTLTGEGSLEAKPELAVIQIGVAVTAKVAKDALAENSRLLARR